MSMFHKTRGANDKTHPPTFDEQLPHLVPGEEARQPIELTPLGERLLLWWRPFSWLDRLQAFQLVGPLAGLG